MNYFNIYYDSVLLDSQDKVLTHFSEEKLNTLCFECTEYEFLGVVYSTIQKAIIECFDEQMEMGCTKAKTNKKEFNNESREANDLVMDIAYKLLEELKIILKVRKWEAKRNELLEVEKELNKEISAQLRPAKEKHEAKGLIWIEILDNMIDKLPEHFDGKRIIYEERLRANII